MNETLCIYHGNCADGFASACVVKRYFDGIGEPIEFHPGVYQQAVPSVINKDVILVDFSYKRATMEILLGVAKSVTIIDHHKTAIADLEGLKFKDSLLSIENSGAMLTWLYFFPGDVIPQLLKHIEDRDLWRFKLPKTREIQAALFSYPYEFPLWERLLFPVRDIEEQRILERLATEGEGIERKHFKDIRELLLVCRKEMVVNGIRVNAANLPYTLSSDAGHIICEESDEPFGCCFYDVPDGRVFSLRSIDSKMDVSEIAKVYGGGGHRNAAGFRVCLEAARAMEDAAC